MALSIGVRRQSNTGEVSKRTLFYLVLILYTLITCVPFVWSILTSFKTLPEANLTPPTGLPVHPTLAAWNGSNGVLSTGNFPRWFVNSIVVAGLVTGGHLFFDSLGGYAFARMRFPGRNAIFLLVLGTLMIPAAMTIVPVYVILAKMPTGSWINTYWGLSVPFMTGAFGLFLMRQFFQSIPVEIEEAAKLDGLNRFGMYWRIALPLSRPALAALAIFSFQGNWDSFMMPRFIESTPDMYTLPVGLQQFNFTYQNYWPQMMAGSMIVIIPILILYIFTQRYFVEGVASTGVKG